MKSVIRSIKMKFQRQDEYARGLVEIRMPRISETVVLAGANGSGKTRTLGVVREIAQRGRPDLSNACEVAYGDIALYEVPSTEQSVATIGSARRDELGGARHQLNSDTANFPANIAQALRMAQVCLDDYLATGNNFLPFQGSDRELRTERWKALQDITGSILGVRLGFDIAGSLTFDGVAADDVFGRLSVGQRKLFSFVAPLVGNPSKNLKVVLFDEPETHLHPQATIEMLKAMQRILKDGQLWIATHSMSIVAGLGLENVWYAEKGVVSFGGSKVERVITSLFGGRDNLAPLRLALSEPDRVAIARFAAECLELPPTAPAPGPREPQFDQALAAIRAVATADAPISILDWGAGRGRFKLWLSQQPAEVQDRVKYFAFEPNSATANELRDAVERATGTPVDVVSDVDAVHKRSKELDAFDIVLLSNVLHEIEPAEWQALFADIRGAMASGGHLLIVEDKLLPIGELPNATGFVLVDRDACAALFNMAPGDVVEQRAVDELRSGRLSCFRIPAAALASVTRNSVVQCLNLLNARAIEGIEQMRQQRRGQGDQIRVSQDDGHLHALQLLQYANTATALRAIELPA